MRASWRVLLHSTGLRLVGLALAFATSVVVARGLGAEARGFYQIVITAGLLGASVGGLSGELGFAERLKTPSAPARSIVLATLAYGSVLWGLCVAVVAAGAAALSAERIMGSEFLPVWEGCLFVAVFALLGVASAWTQRALNLLARPVSAAGASTIELTLPLVGVLVALAGGFFSLTSVLIFSAAGTVVGVLVSLRLTRLRVRDIRARELFAGMSAGLKFHPSQIALQLLARFDVILLGAMASLASVGHYTVAVSITAPLAVLATSVSTTFLNRQFVDSDGDADIATLRILGVTLVVVVMCSIVIGLASWPLIPLLWGIEFEESRLLLLVLLPGVVAMAAQRPLGNYFVRYGLAGAMTLRVMVALGIDLLLCIFLIPTHGALGAAIASTCAYGAYAAVSFGYFARTSGYRVRHLLEELRRRPISPGPAEEKR